MMIGRALYSWDDGLRIAIAPTVAYKRKSWYIRILADGRDRKVHARDKYDHTPRETSGFFHFPTCSIALSSHLHL